MLHGRKDWWFGPSGFFTSWVAFSFQRRPLLHAVSLLYLISLQDPLQNGTSKQTASAKGTVTVSVNSQHPGQKNSSSRSPHSYNSDPKATNIANKIHIIESDKNPRSKLPVTSTENKTPVPVLIKPAIQSAADKLTKSLGTNNRVTITVPNGVKSSE